MYCMMVRSCPFSDNNFDVTLLYFVLHHCQFPEQVLGEALRVTRKRLIVVESVYEGRWDHWLLKTLDQLANRLRSDGLMKKQEEFLHFKTIPDWQNIFNQHRSHTLKAWQYGKWIHKQAFFCLEPA